MGNYGIFLTMGYADLHHQPYPAPLLEFLTKFLHKAPTQPHSQPPERTEVTKAALNPKTLNPKQ